VLYESNIINEYLDERCAPAADPVDPVSRARARLMLVRFDRDWYSLIHDITGGDKKAATKARHALRDGSQYLARSSRNSRFSLGEEFSLVDCSLAPLLWRLDRWDVELPRQAKPILDYAGASSRAILQALVDRGGEGDAARPPGDRAPRISIFLRALVMAHDSANFT